MGLFLDAEHTFWCVDPPTAGVTQRGAVRDAGDSSVVGAGVQHIWLFTKVGVTVNLSDSHQHLSVIMTSTDIAVFPILADPDQNNLQSIQLLVGQEVVSGRMDGCRASVLHSCSCRDRPKLGRLQYTVRSRYKRIVYKRIWVASLPFQSVWATFCSY